jgi:lipid A 3-O-deacylase
MVAAAVGLAACAAATDGDDAFNGRVLPDTRVVTEHFQQALAQHGPYRFYDPPEATWAGAVRPVAAGKEPAPPSFWSRLWPTSTSTRPTQPEQTPFRMQSGWKLPPLVAALPAPNPAPAKTASFKEHFWPELAGAESSKPKAERSDPAMASPAAQSGPPQGKGAGLTEVRVGALKHAVAFGHRAKEQGMDGNVEALFASPDWLRWAFSPRPHLGLTANASKRATDFLYAGLTWDWTFREAIFVDVSLGFSVHDGMLDNSMIAGRSREDRREFGCRALFRESLEFGYRFLERHSLSLMWEHHSHGSLCSEENEGIDNAGLRYGFRM